MQAYAQNDVTKAYLDTYTSSRPLQNLPHHPFSVWTNRMHLSNTWKLEGFTPLALIHEPIQALLDSPDDSNELVDKWYNAKIQELQYVGVTVSYLSLELEVHQQACSPFINSALVYFSTRR